MKPGIYQRVAPIILAPQNLLTPSTKEVITDTASVSVWINRTLRQVIRKGVDRSTPGDICNFVSVVEPPSPIFLHVSQEVGNKRKSTSLGLVRNSQKLDAVVDRKLTDDINLTSILSKFVGHKLSNGSRGDIYTRCRMNFGADPFYTHSP